MQGNNKHVNHSYNLQTDAAFIITLLFLSLHMCMQKFEDETLQIQGLLCTWVKVFSPGLFMGPLAVEPGSVPTA